MQIREALRIVQALADGVDPNTGEVMPEDSPYQHPQIVRALLTAVKVLEHQWEAERRKRQLPDRTGKPWDAAEDEQLLKAYDSGKKLNELAKQHDRTRGAIIARLEKLGKGQPFGQLPGAEVSAGSHEKNYRS